METDSFVLIPSIGPLVLGHVIIVSKFHFESLATMGEQRIEEFHYFLQNILKKKVTNQDFLIFEHGSYDGEKGGNCIMHTHIHIMPELGKHYNVLDNLLIATDLGSIKDLVNVDFPYILSLNNQHGFRIYEAYNAYSQMMRKALAHEIKLNGWNWRENENEKLIKLSYEYWKN